MEVATEKNLTYIRNNSVVICAIKQGVAASLRVGHKDRDFAIARIKRILLIIFIVYFQRLNSRAKIRSGIV